MLCVKPITPRFPFLLRWIEISPACRRACPACLERTRSPIVGKRGDRPCRGRFARSELLRLRSTQRSNTPAITSETVVGCACAELPSFRREICRPVSDRRLAGTGRGARKVATPCGGPLHVGADPQLPSAPRLPPVLQPSPPVRRLRPNETRQAQRFAQLGAARPAEVIEAGRRRLTLLPEGELRAELARALKRRSADLPTRLLAAELERRRRARY